MTVDADTAATVAGVGGGAVEVVHFVRIVTGLTNTFADRDGIVILAAIGLVTEAGHRAATDGRPQHGIEIGGILVLLTMRIVTGDTVVAVGAGIGAAGRITVGIVVIFAAVTERAVRFGSSSIISDTDEDVQTIGIVEDAIKMLTVGGRAVAGGTHLRHAGFTVTGTGKIYFRRRRAVDGCDDVAGVTGRTADR